jgi:predicted nucleotidyltransferase
MSSETARPLWELVRRSRTEIRELARRHHARQVSIFGSVARGEETENSDIDFLVEFEPQSSLLDLLHLQDDLSELLSRPVDVVSAGGLRARDKHIRDEAVRV